MNRKEIRLASGETVKVQNEWAAECEERGSTVSASVWEANSLTLSGQTLTGTLTSVLIASPVDCSDVLRNTVTLSNGETLIADREVIVS